MSKTVSRGKEGHYTFIKGPLYKRRYNCKYMHSRTPKQMVHIQKIMQNVTINLNTGLNAIKFSAENIELNLYDHRIDNGFLEATLKGKSQ
jgi:hypothetical protein